MYCVFCFFKERNMDIRTCVFVLFGLIGLACAEPVKYIDCGEFHFTLFECVVSLPCPSDHQLVT